MVKFSASPSSLPSFTASHLRLTKPSPVAASTAGPRFERGRGKGRKRGTKAEGEEEKVQADGDESKADGGVDGASGGSREDWRLEELRAKRAFIGHLDSEGGGGGTSGASASGVYVLLYSRDATRYPFTVHSVDFVTMREVAQYAVLSLEEAEQRMKSRTKRFEKLINAVPTLAKLEGERHQEQRREQRQVEAGGGGEGGEGVVGGGSSDGQGVQIKRKQVVGVSHGNVEGEDDFALLDSQLTDTAAGRAGKRGAGGEAAGAGDDDEDDDDDPFSFPTSKAGAGRRGGGRGVARKDREAAIDFRAEFDDDDETHEEPSVLADADVEEEEAENVDEPTLESEEEEDNEAGKKRTEELLKKADEDEKERKDGMEKGRKKGGRGSKGRGQAEDDSDEDDDDDDSDDSSGVSSDDDGDDDDADDDSDDADDDVDMDDGEGKGQEKSEGDRSSVAASQPSSTQPSPLPAEKDRKRSRGPESDPAAVAVKGDGALVGDGQSAAASDSAAAPAKRLRTAAFPSAAAPAISAPGSGPASTSSPPPLTDAIVLAEFAATPRLSVTELTKRLTKTMAPHPIDKAAFIDILKRCCELDPTTKTLSIKQQTHTATNATLAPTPPVSA